jgi:calcineurin-like phosphoesterase family protein
MCIGLIENWNQYVSDNDIVFVLGDTFWFNDSRNIKKVLSQLNGKDIYILPGNHDDFEAYYRVDDLRIHLCADVVVCWFTQEGEPKREVWMSHYPMMTWPHRENGAWQLFGHIHSQPGKDTGVDQDLPLHWNQVDVGCDRWFYRPVSLNLLTEMFTDRKKYKEFAEEHPYQGN